MAFAGPGSATCGRSAGPVQAIGVDQRLNIALSDGRTVRLGGLDAPSPDRGAPDIAQAAHDFLSKRLIGREADLIMLAAAPDRWGRTVADLSIPESAGGPISSTAAALLAAGLARVRPEFETRGCAAERLAIEDGARRAGSGIWRDPDFAVIKSTDLAALRRQDGRFVIIEGAIRRVGFARYRLYLELVPHDGPTVVIARKLEPALARERQPVGALVGQTIRARGALEDRFGLRTRGWRAGDDRNNASRQRVGGIGAAAMSRQPGSLGRTAAPWRRRCALMALAGLFAVSLAACATVDPPPTPVSFTPATAPRAVSSPAVSPERKRLIDAFGGVYTQPATEAYLNGVLIKLGAASDGGGQPYRVTMLNSPIVNAFALPSGDIFVTRGLLALADDTSEIAAVMAHEIGHITARHAAQRAEFEKTTALFSRVNTQLLAQREAQDEAEARSKLAIARFSREQEFAADQIGIKTVAHAGYDPYAASRFLTALGEWSALRASVSGAGSANRPDMMATHPSTPERVAQATEEARKFGAPGTGEVGRPAYLAAIDGLAFGDDPSQGVVRDNLFIHPKLGFAFDAPEGFTLDNQSTALIGVAETGREALRLDSVAIADSTPVASAIGSGWIDGVKTTSIEPKQIGGLEAATAIAQGDQWSFRLGAVRLNGRLYRLIFAAHTLSPAVDLQFMASLDSFHLINAQDSGMAEPQKIALIEAASGDTAETLAGRMGFLPQALDQFLILNGLERAPRWFLASATRSSPVERRSRWRRKARAIVRPPDRRDPQLGQVQGDPRAAQTLWRRGCRRRRVQP